MGGRKKWKSGLCCCVYDRPCINKRLRCFRKSWDEVVKALNPKCGCKKC